jgi:AcrR family transcriptional regulator
MRADARRNYERILAAAAEAVARDGAEASLEEIARRAGVGSATLHRHFPTRTALLEVVFHDRVEVLCAQAVALAAAADAGEALVTWLRALGAYASTTRGLPASLLRSADSDSCHAMLTQSAGELLRRAQAAGAVRPGVSVDDLIALVVAISLAAEGGPPAAADHGPPAGAERGPKPGAGADRLLLLAIDGIRPPSITLPADAGA